ncbi:hypothetical protein CYLTODRAFT_455350 [Cylindrobasidium torrendii FP15055 ss-10]|uniref:Rhodopsin domain-containing protein n=1 Tax=Cylindrobasidium torrendii FP15055 ss-10 TaxID=1314674 RepID=A0A0D7BA96_9AGAR|nr:hypothetical protein CYLTODRAFT_455350 [Cylindrobasidium torrendii FP15055 ss-10]
MQPSQLHSFSRATSSAVDDEMHRKIFVSAAVGMTIAACTTVARVVARFRRFGLDDALAVAGLASLIITAVAGALYYKIDEHSTVPQTSRVALYYIFAVTFDVTIWISRLSIMVNIIRLGSYQRRLYITAALFVIALLILVAQVFWVCEPQNRHNHWKSDLLPQCVLGRSVAITQVTTDVFADVILVIVPLLLLRYLQSEKAKAQKLRLTVSFGVGGLTTIVSIVHAVYLLQGTQISIVVSNVEMSVSVIICNFAVLAAAIHNLWNKCFPAKTGPEHTTMQFETNPARPPTHSGWLNSTASDLSSVHYEVGKETDGTDSTELRERGKASQGSHQPMGSQWPETNQVAVHLEAHRSTESVLRA